MARPESDRDKPVTKLNYARAGRYQVAVKVIDIFGNDTMTLLPISVG